MFDTRSLFKDFNNALGADHMGRIIPVSWADSCHEYLFLATKEDLNRIKDVFASKLNQFFF